VIPASLSASSLEVAMLCMARWEAEYFHKGTGFQGVAAALGSSVHGALESYVREVYIEKKQPADFKLLIALYDISWMSIHGSLEKGTPEYKDGWKMLRDWFDRGDLDQPGRTVLTVETKTNFILPIKKYGLEIPFNYIWDRFDQLGEHEYSVVDYKSNRVPLGTDELRKKIQARAYGLAGQLRYPDAERIWVEFDFLRFDGPPVGVAFSAEDNREFWREIKAKAIAIIETPEGQGLETLNQNCSWCVRKHVCTELQKHVFVGGVLSMEGDEQVNARAELQFKLEGLSAALAEIDKVLLNRAKEDNLDHFETAAYELDIKVTGRRGVDAERVEMIIGPQLMAQYGSRGFTMKSLEKLLKSTAVTESQKNQLKLLITTNYSDPSFKAKRKL
jgi:hypothetical protein